MTESHARTPATPSVLVDPLRNRGVAFTPEERDALGVLPCEVGDAAGGWLALECGVSAVVIVGVKPG
ncbi:hypothetical protein, partial [Streptomyces sp. NPDC093097]|uniref:hypothetical protein n=1 Tax=Streptomyces sp. NPDC093097 TaxID=3366027 RepID=UPI0038129271